MTRLCESCATDEPKAPSCVSPKPLTRPRPIRPEARCRSMLAIKSTSRSGSNAQWPSTRRTRARRVPGDDLVGDDLDHGTCLRREGQAECLFVERPQVDRVLTVEPRRGTVGRGTCRRGPRPFPP